MRKLGRVNTRLKKIPEKKCVGEKLGRGDAACDNGKNNSSGEASREQVKNRRKLQAVNPVSRWHKSLIPYCNYFRIRLHQRD